MIDCNIQQFVNLNYLYYFEMQISNCLKFLIVWKLNLNFSKYDSHINYSKDCQYTFILKMKINHTIKKRIVNLSSGKKECSKYNIM